MIVNAMQGYIRNTKLSSQEKEEKIPAIIYGRGLKENLMIYIFRKEFMNFFNIVKKDCYAKIVSLKIEKKEYTAIIRDIQWKKDSTTPYPIHLDFFELSGVEKLSTKMYISFLNEDKCVGVKNGGKLQIKMKDCRVTANPNNMPSKIEVDIKSLGIGEKIMTNQLEEIYKSCNLQIKQKQVVASITGK